MHPALQRLSNRIWLLIGGGSLLFIGAALYLAATHPQTPANQLVNSTTIWLFAPGVVLVVYGAWFSLRYWRCPYCGATLRTRFPIPRDCLRCGRDLGLGRR